MAVVFGVSWGSEVDFRRVDVLLTEDSRVVELLLALGDSCTVSLRVPSGHHMEVGARRPPPKISVVIGYPSSQRFCPGLHVVWDNILRLT